MLGMRLHDMWNFTMASAARMHRARRIEVAWRYAHQNCSDSWVVLTQCMSTISVCLPMRVTM